MQLDNSQIRCSQSFTGALDLVYKGGIMMSEAILCLGCMKTNEVGEPCPYCGFEEKAHLAKLGKKSALYLKLGSMLAQDQYIVGRVIGQGNFGITYIGLDTQSHRRVAIKEYMPRSLSYRSPENQQIIPFNEDNRLSYAFGLQQFLKEAGILASLKEHPGVVKVHQVFQQNGTAYMVMEYLEGRTLEIHIQHSLEAMPWEDAASLIHPVIDILKSIHEAGLIHRDICPENIFLCIDGSIKLFDFGGARQALIDQNKNLSVVLKPGYAPLENYISKGKRGPWTDIYSLNATLFRMVTGVRIPEASVRIEKDTLAQRMAEIQTIPNRVKPVMLRALAVRAEERYSDINTFRREFYSAAGFDVSSIDDEDRSQVPASTPAMEYPTGPTVSTKPPAPVSPPPQPVQRPVEAPAPAQVQRLAEAPAFVPAPPPQQAPAFVPAAGNQGDPGIRPVLQFQAPQPSADQSNNMSFMVNNSRSPLLMILIFLIVAVGGFAVYWFMGGTINAFVRTLM